MRGVTDWMLMAGIVAALLAGLYLTAPNTIEEQAQIDRYCEMVDAWQTSDGEYGWPPYRENVDCEE